MAEQVMLELLSNGPLVAVLAWQLHLTQSRVLTLLERIYDQQQALANPASPDRS
jgi:hypothetical protein